MPLIAKAFWEDRKVDPVVKYVPGDSIPDDHPKRDWLVRSGIAAVAPATTEVVVVADQDDSDDVAVADVAPATTVDGKPKPTDSIEKHREYATKHGIDSKNLSRAQLVKAIRDL